MPESEPKQHLVVYPGWHNMLPKERDYKCKSLFSDIRAAELTLTKEYPRGKRVRRAKVKRVVPSVKGRSCP